MRFARRFCFRLVLRTLVTSMLIGLVGSNLNAQLRIDFTRAADDEPLQAGWTPFQGDGTDPITNSLDLNGKSVDVTVSGNTHWRDYQAATGGFEPHSNLLRDGVLCNNTCDMSLTLENLDDGDYDVRTYLHTTQFGAQDGRPFTPFAISLTDANVTNSVVNAAVVASDNSSADLSTQTIPFRVVGGSPVSIVLSKPGGNDHMQLDGIELGVRGSLGDPPIIIPPPPRMIDVTIPDGLKVDFSRAPDELPLQEGWTGFVGDGTDTVTQAFDFQGKTVNISLGGNTHWRDYRAATGPFAEFSDLLSDSPLCNDACEMKLTLSDLADGSYELFTVLHTTQFGAQDGRPFTPVEIRLTHGILTDVVINSEKFISDDSSDDLATQTIPFRVVGGSPVEVVFAKPGGNDHFALSGFVLSVPEPTGIGGLLVGLLLGLQLRRRRK